MKTFIFNINRALVAKKSKLFALFLALVAGVGTLFAESGTCGENLTWDLTNGVLTISGTGNMTNYKWNGAPWYSYKSSITEVSIGNSVTSIGNNAFYGCSGLTSLTIPTSVTSIGNSAFQYCSGLTSVTIPNSVTSIGEGTFCGCSGLTSIEIPNSVTSIGYIAFEDCTGLTSVTIPNSVTNIGDYAFSRVNNIVYSGTATGSPWGAKSINGYVEDLLVYSDNSKTMLVGCSSAVTGKITIPNSVTSIGDNAFFYCTGLTSVSIPGSVTSIGDGAFYGCSGLTSVTFCGETPASLGNLNFDGCYNLDAIYVPCGTIDAYKSSWSSWTSKIKYPNLEYDVQVNVNIPEAGIVNKPLTICDIPIAAVPNYGYHFVQWSDGVIDNPRSFELTQDTTFTAEFAHNPVVTYIFNSTMGNVSGPTITETGIASADITFEATTNYGYHFVSWKDGNTDNPRTIYLSKDTTMEAIFAKNEYTITTSSANPDWGTTEGASALYLDEILVSATPNYGYHFDHWEIEKYKESIEYKNTHNPYVVKFSVPDSWTNPYAWIWPTSGESWVALDKENDMYVYRTEEDNRNIILVPNGASWDNGQTNDLAITESCCYTITGERGW